MTVYFVVPVADRTRVKVGTTVELENRLKAIATEFEEGIELVGQTDGGRETEVVLHRILAPYWLEGEWYAYSAEVRAIVSQFGTNVSGRRVWGRLRAVKGLPENAYDEDKQIAHGLLRRVMDLDGAAPMAIAQKNAFERLSAINPMWTRRRVRAIWEQVARRIDHYEIRNMETALQSQVRGLRGLDSRTGTEG